MLVMNTDWQLIVQQIINQKELPKEVLIDAVKSAVLKAAKKRYGENHSISVNIDENSGEIKVKTPKKVVEIMQHFATEIPVEEAQKIDGNVEIGDFIEVEVNLQEFGRIEAQTARQTLIQKIREAENEMIYNEFSSQIGEIVTTTIQRIEPKGVIVDVMRKRKDLSLSLETVEGIIPPKEQIKGEDYERGEQVKCIILRVKKSFKQPPIILSRSDPRMVARLFELEVPEIYEGIVQIKGIARDPGGRSKVAVTTTEENVDAVGTCVGPRGSRVQMVVSELNGEKIELIEWNSDPATYIGNALKPAEISRVSLDEKSGVARVIVPDGQLSLAIGKKGQNVRLAAMLTGWKIDIKGESESKSEVKEEIVEKLFKSEEE